MSVNLLTTQLETDSRAQIRDFDRGEVLAPLPGFVLGNHQNVLSGDCGEHLETGAVLSPERSEEVHQMMLRRVH
ncbi:hypothetical protein AM1_A0330 (plasmid) [Acaryochloris marina MBIC11017]|uniref:Uncharacterized protein n=1 Tax=Acaryochloris marina (strain MBIC 11017) TaxID=329726 RepID=A8ZKY0_ACAM1|nr:hypothetical protein AM1_A0330 [Acaryochloris marina MBIC11017]